ncbi:hypothetical protein SAMN02927937_00676 [Paenimyroides aquimaris]|uniref:Glycerophosphoryl diester phosphodiesterase membrane domain-containing protein n=1 Tax=Paenimyroides marinum TaxID=1159016 RepID=A0A1H6JYK5_9FLAO|nr:hypothetical protein [Paenimyroides aquimaris]SEH65095.1 hypothetical protein SAMN02927937_00676 [Paenimyroides aquimaris]
MHNTFQLFKIRGFGEFISDTFQFLKLHGKNYFKNYLKFSFVPLLLLMVAMSVIGTFYYRVLTTSFGYTQAAETFDNAFVTENAVMLVVGIIALIFVSLYLSLLNYSYPVYYLHLLAKNNEEKPQLRSVRELFKNDLGRLLLFGLLSLITFLIVGIIGFAIAAILTFIIIGIFAFILFIPFLMTWYSLTLYFYIDKKQSFFDAFKHAFYTITNNFWNIVGASLCMMIIAQVISTIVTIIPYMITMFGMFFGTQQGTGGLENMDDSISIFMVAMVLVYCFSILVSMILGHLLLIQTGLVYYSEREKLEYNTMRQSIDEIGKYE